MNRRQIERNFETVTAAIAAEADRLVAVIRAAADVMQRRAIDTHDYKRSALARQRQFVTGCVSELQTVCTVALAAIDSGNPVAVTHATATVDASKRLVVVPRVPVVDGVLKLTGQGDSVISLGHLRAEEVDQVGGSADVGVPVS